GPQNGRIFAAPATGLTTLTDETAVLKSTRDREAKAAGGTGEATIAPSQAAKPKTDAIETSSAIKTPSKAKASAAAEAVTSVAAPKQDEKAADKAVDGKPRSHAGKQAEPAQ